MYHIFFIHSSVSGHLSCFFALAIVNSDTMNIKIHEIFSNHVFLWMFVQDWDYWIIHELFLGF